MGLEIASSRPLARLLVRALTGRSTLRGGHRGPYVPPIAPCPVEPCDVTEERMIETSRRILGTVLTGQGLETWAHLMRTDIVVWSPGIFAMSCQGAVDALSDVELASETLSEVSTDVTNVQIAAPHSYLEWRLSGRFTSACFVDDDVMLEPTGRLVETCGVLVVTFSRNEVAAIHCYYDDLAMLEQLVDV